MMKKTITLAEALVGF